MPNALFKVVTAARALKFDHAGINVRHQRFFPPWPIFRRPASYRAVPLVLGRAMINARSSYGRPRSSPDAYQPAIIVGWRHSSSRVLRRQISATEGRFRHICQFTRCENRTAHRPPRPQPNAGSILLNLLELPQGHLSRTGNRAFRSYIGIVRSNDVVRGTLSRRGQVDGGI